MSEGVARALGACSRTKELAILKKIIFKIIEKQQLNFHKSLKIVYLVVFGQPLREIDRISV